MAVKALQKAATGKETRKTTTSKRTEASSEKSPLMPLFRVSRKRHGSPHAGKNYRVLKGRITKVYIMVIPIP